MLHFFIGTKAQYIKTAPILRILEQYNVPYRLIDSGQHASFGAKLRPTLDIKEPDIYLQKRGDLDSIPKIALWFLKFSLVTAFRPGYLRKQLFSDQPGFCVLHGDTPSTLISALMAKRARLSLVHLEAGLRSHNLFRPFPEELIRLIVSKISDHLLAPNEESVQNLKKRKVKGRIYNTGGNTNYDSLLFEKRKNSARRMEEPFALITLHRVENVMRKSVMEEFVRILYIVSEHFKPVFILHPPTEKQLKKFGLLAAVKECPNIETHQLIPHQEFTRYLSHASVVLTDGGSIQEECSYLGVPTLLLRKETERNDGLGRNVVVSRFDLSIVRRFLEYSQDYRYEDVMLDSSPSLNAVRYLLELEALFPVSRKNSEEAGVIGR
jgi:UDP-N-acetylglucosamine 2-epimerase (non-hydrolysing)